MVIFTSPDLKERIESIRKGKSTKIITFDLNKKFKHILKKIKTVQELDEFKSKVSPKQIKNIEYWSNHYVLVNNLKTFFVNLAIKEFFGSIRAKQQFAWLDFGYVRNRKILNTLSEWNYPFEKGKIHLFSINDISKLTSESDIYHAIFNNEPYIIGGSIVGDKLAWARFNQVIFNTQKNFIKNNIIDDDQGVYLISYFKNRDLIQVNYLGKDNWFGLFKKFSNKKTSLFRRIIDKLR